MMKQLLFVSSSLFSLICLCASMAACEDSVIAHDEDTYSSSSKESGVAHSEDDDSLKTSSGVESSSGTQEVNSSSGEEIVIPKGWSWDVPKEFRLNQNIEYDSIKDSRDGKIYKTIKIGNLIWMAENLNYYDEKNMSLKDKSWCYNTDVDEDISCKVVGRHYTWAAAIDSVKLATDATNPMECGYGKECGLSGKVRGICPPGWYLPSDDEWNDLITFVGNNSTTGKELKTQSGWWTKGGTNGIDTYGFSALPAGYVSDEGYSDAVGGRAAFWSSSEKCDNGASYLAMFYDKDEAFMRTSCGYAFTKDCGLSVRCVKDVE